MIYKILLIFLVALVIFLEYNHLQCFVAKENKVEMKSKKIKSDIKITQITDFHSNVLNNLDFVLNSIKKFNPDFIILTGDINDYGVQKKFDRAMYFVKKIASLGIKTYYIIGNHEQRGPMKEEFLNELIKNKLEVLHNSGTEIFVNDNKIYIYGTGFYDFDYKNFNPKDNYVNIVLAHHSRFIRENYTGDEDFVFSGHTHGGQVRAPFLGALYAPGEGFLPKYDKGVFDYKGFKIHIDSGLGNTKYNLRFLNRIQFSNITLKSANSSMVE